MDFQHTYLHCLKTSALLTKSISLMDYLPRPIDVLPHMKENLPYVEAFQELSCTYPYHYALSDLSSYCLLYTNNGMGALTTGGYTYSLTASTLAFINCEEFHKLEIKQNSWDYKVFFISGVSVSYLYNTITKEESVMNLSPNSPIINMISKLYSLLDKEKQNSFLSSKLILDILFEIILENNRSLEEKTLVPNYLQQIKNDFDTNFQKNYSLDNLEQEYSISRYRICREFSKYFGISPIQYLNHKRIHAAKETLMQTDKRIHEIGQMVGYENTNHFIRLFKQQTGVTPLEFRKQPPVQNLFY